ncbi:MAG: hypothetical protein AAF664_20965, partial [Planctomycetota bacterium]
MRPIESLLRRLMFVLPVYFAFCCHAIALERWSLSIPATVGLVFFAWEPTKSRPSSRQWYVVIIAGLIVGFLVPASDVSAGPLSPVFAAALTGVAIAIALYAIRVDQTTVAWAASWALVTISAKTRMVGSLRAFLLLFFFSSLVAALIRSRPTRSRAGGWIVVGLFMAMLAVSTSGVSALIQRADRVFLDSVERFISSDGKTELAGLGNRITLRTKDSITLTMEPLMEISEQTGYLRSKVMDQFDDSQWSTSLNLL